MAEKLNIKQDSVEMVTYPLTLRKSVHQAAELWQAFCTLPPEVKQRFAASNQQNGVGYEAKDGTGSHGDRKENFDYARKGRDDLRAALSQTDNPIAHGSSPLLRSSVNLPSP